MLTCNTNPIKCNFVKSYDDLVGKPSINGVTLEGNISFDDLGLSAWLEEETKNFLTTSELDTKLAGYIKSESNGINAEGFTIEDGDDSFSYSTSISTLGVDIQHSGFYEYSFRASSADMTIANVSAGNTITLTSDGFVISTFDNYAFLDAATLRALIDHL